MSSLDKITDKIIEQANEKANKILHQAEVKVKEIQERVKNEQNSLIAETKIIAEKEHKIVIEQSESSDRQERRQQLLAVKRKCIRQVISESKQQIESLPKKEYFDLLLRLFKRNALPDNGKIYFSRLDSRRVPVDFIKQCNEFLKEGSVELAGENKTINNGFVITYGKVEIDCSIDSIFKSNSQILEDKAAVFLK